MAVNTTGTWNIGTEAIRRMSQQEQRRQPGLIPGTERSLPAGSIVNIGSGASLRGIPDMAVYCASKHAVLGLTRSWAKDWPSLRVNMVAPGKCCSHQNFLSLAYIVVIDLMALVFCRCN